MANAFLVDRRDALKGLTALAAGTMLPGSIAAQTDGWPKQPIRILCGFAAGGGNDVFARMVGQRLSEKLGQAVVVENRPGAGSIIAYEQTARATPDGYTLLIAPFGATIVNPAVYAKLPYDPANLQPLSIVASFPFVMVVRSDLNINSIEDLVKHAKANPDKANYGTPSVTFQLLVELFKARTGAPFEHIPFKSTAEVLTALLNGQLMMSFVDPGPLIGHLKGGRVKALAHSGSARFPHIPDVPTMAEAGYPDVQGVTWNGLLAPKATPTAVVERLSLAVRTALATPAVKDKLAALGSEARANTPEEFQRFLEADFAKWGALMKQANIKVTE